MKTLMMLTTNKLTQVHDFGGKCDVGPADGTLVSCLAWHSCHHVLHGTLVIMSCMTTHRLHCLVLAIIVLLCLAFDLDEFVWFYPCHRSIRLVHQVSRPVSPRSNAHHMLVDGAKCHMVEWPLFDAQTGPLYRNASLRTIDCNRSQVRIERRNLSAIFIPDVKRLKLRCFARQVMRNAQDDDQYVLGQHRLGPLGTLTSLDSWDAARVDCYGKLRTASSKFQWTLMESKVIAFVPLKKAKAINKDNKLNVLLLGIDSISWLNFRRHFTKSTAFFARHNFTPMFGFNKVGDNTFPNLVGALTGRHYLDFWNSSIGREMKFDNVETIWKGYERAGYLTTLIEDMPMFSVFNYNRGGFRKQPTDYYLRPVSILIDDNKNHRFCYKDELTMQYYYSYILDQLQAFRQRGQAFLTISHLADLTHNLHLNAGQADGPLSHFLENMFAKNLEKSTVIIVFSDHGIRFGRLRKTTSGSYEERSPFAYIYVPENQKIVGLEPSEARRVLASNSHRLTCHFDLHATMRHLLETKAPEDEPYGRSWLTPISENRSCEEAGIAPTWCLCSGYVALDIDSALGHQLAQVVIDHVNAQLDSHAQCARVSFLRLESLKAGKFAIVDKESGKLEKRMFVVQLRMAPSKGQLEATLETLWRSKKSRPEIEIHPQFGTLQHAKVVGEISRLDRYAPQAWCIHNAIVEKFCLCNRSTATTTI